MSNPFAIAAVSAALQGLLRRHIAGVMAGGSFGALPPVLLLPPDFINNENPPRPCLNLFLYEVALNPGLASEYLPTHGTDGSRLTNPVLPLDLHYLLTAFGPNELQSETLLGHAMLALQESPGLSRAAIRNLLDPAAAGNPLPAAFRQRAIAIADQSERITITPIPLSSDAMSRVWSAMQGHLRPSMAYKVSVVLIEGTRPTATPFPVLTRGSEVQPNLAFTTPMLSEIIPPNNRVVALPGDVITLTGAALAGRNAQAVLRQLASPRRFVVPIGNVAGDDRVNVDLALANPAGSLAAGQWQLLYEVIRPGEMQVRRTNELSLTISPVVNWPPLPAVNINRPAPNQLQLTFAVNPPIRAGQSASVFLGGEEWTPALFAADNANPVFTQVVSPPFRIPGTHLFRLRVDDAETLTVRRPLPGDPPGTPPMFEPAAQIVLP